MAAVLKAEELKERWACDDRYIADARTARDGRPRLKGWTLGRGRWRFRAADIEEFERALVAWQQGVTGRRSDAGKRASDGRKAAVDRLAPLVAAGIGDGKSRLKMGRSKK